MTDLATRHAVERKGTPPLTREEAEHLRRETPDWALEENGKAIHRLFTLKDFKEAITFVQAVADVAESEDHHPDIFNSYKKVRLTLSTHSIGGLSENDFILAAKIDRLYRERFAKAPVTRAEA